MKCMLENKEIRKDMLRRYLDVETSVEEERALMEYFMQHAPDDEEKALAAMIVGETLIRRADSEDSVVSERKTMYKKFARYWWTGMAAAIAAVVVCLVWLSDDNVVDADVDRTAVALNVVPQHAVDSKKPVAQSTPEPVTKPKAVTADVKIPKCNSLQLSEEPRRVVDEILAVLDVDDEALVSCDIVMKGDGAVVTKIFADGEPKIYLLAFGKDGEYDLIALNGE
ncbi:MAG: hypothetical protein ACI4AH_07875 [Muribaculaceae bacterium]